MKNVTVYTFEVCPFCVQAKLMLQGLNVDFKEIELTRDELAEFSAKTGMSTVPQIFFGEELIGGFTDLAALVQSGEVHDKLK